jgi:hypothetical protein
MRGLLAVLFALAFAVTARAQERHVRVELESGEVLEGNVLAMDLATLRIQVGGQVRTLDATRIRGCRFDDPPGPGAARGASAAPGNLAAAAEPEPTRPAAAAAGSPEPVPLDPDGAEPLALLTDARSLLGQRVDRLEDTYPWLHPAAPMQWLSLGLLLAILATLAIHVSVHVAGAEGASLGRSSGLAIWYLATGLAQMACVPASDFTVAMMLLVNPALALFWLTGLFGLHRIGASIAFAVQLGFIALGYGVLELVSAVLASVGAVSA